MLRAFLSIGADQRLLTGEDELVNLVNFENDINFGSAQRRLSTSTIHIDVLYHHEGVGRVHGA